MKRVALILLLAAPLAAADFPIWMRGAWSARIDGAQMEEQWTSAEGDVMLGLHRSVSPGRKTQFEFLRIEKREGVLTYVAQPGGNPPTVFPLKSAGEGRIAFENPAHDFPQRIEYWLEDGKLCARVSGSRAEGMRSEQWCWSPASALP